MIGIGRHRVAFVDVALLAVDPLGLHQAGHGARHLERQLDPLPLAHRRAEASFRNDRFASQGRRLNGHRRRATPPDVDSRRSSATPNHRSPSNDHTALSSPSFAFSLRMPCRNTSDTVVNISASDTLDEIRVGFSIRPTAEAQKTALRISRLISCAQGLLSRGRGQHLIEDAIDRLALAGTKFAVHIGVEPLDLLKSCQQMFLGQESQLAAEFLQPSVDDFNGIGFVSFGRLLKDRDNLLKHQPNQPLLVATITIDGDPGHACLEGDVGEAHLLCPPSQKYLQRGIGNSSLCFGDTACYKYITTCIISQSERRHATA